MSRSAALVRARSLREALLDHGVPKVSIEIQQGRPGTPHDRWYDDRFIGSMGHHIVSRRSQGLTPGLSLIKRGRIDVPGPLCNGYGGFDRVARIICMGWANHPGAGGPYTLPSGRVPANNGRPYLFGWEHEGGLILSDWTDEMRAFMGSCHAGTLDWLGLRDTSHIEHFTWTDRKIDRLKYTLTSARAEVRDNWATQEDDMTPEQADMLQDLHVALVNGNRAQVQHPHDDGTSSVRYGVQQTWRNAWIVRMWRVAFHREHWSVKAGVMAENDGYLVTTALRNIWAHAKQGSGRAHAAEQAAIRAEARSVANTALLERIVDADGSTPLTGDEVRQIMEQALRDNVVRVQVTVDAQEDDDTAEQAAEADTDA